MTTFTTIDQTIRESEAAKTSFDGALAELKLSVSQLRHELEAHAERIDEIAVRSKGNGQTEVA
jgi:hypothetical protein